MLKALQMMSVNQIAAQIGKINRNVESTKWLSVSTESFGSSTNSKKSFMGSSTRLWNAAPEEIKKALSFTSAKKIIKAYCKTLPI